MKRHRLTREQEELRLSGLRILARLIARRCLADLPPGVDQGSTGPDGDGTPDVEAAREEELA